MTTSAKITDQLIARDQFARTIFYPKTDVAQHEADVYGALNGTRHQNLIDHVPLVHDLFLGRFQAPPAQITPISSGGTFHLLYKVELADHPDQSFIVRLNRLKEYRTSWEFLIDAWVYPKLSSLGLPGPSIIAIDCSRNLCPTDYQILTYVQGQTLSAFQDQETQYMNPVLLQAIGAYVAQVHSVKLAGFGPLALTPFLPTLRRSLGYSGFCPVRGECCSELCSLECIESMNSSAQPSPSGIHTTWQDYIFLRLEEHIEICTRIQAITPAEAHEIQKIFLDHKHIFHCSNPVLLHGDLGNHNFLSHDGLSISALIDWEDCMSGDAIFDIAYWGTFFRDHMLKDFLVGYTKHAKLPDDFELRYWLYFLRIALSKTVHRFRFGYQDHPGRPSASLRIQRALENIIKIKTDF